MVYAAGIWLPAMVLANVLMWSGTDFYPIDRPPGRLSLLVSRSPAGDGWPPAARRRPAHLRAGGFRRAAPAVKTILEAYFGRRLKEEGESSESENAEEGP